MFLAKRNVGIVRNAGLLSVYQPVDSDDLCLSYENPEDAAHNWTGIIQAGTYQFSGGDEIKQRAKEILSGIIITGDNPIDSALNLDYMSPYYIAGMMTKLTYLNLNYVCDHCSLDAPLHTVSFFNTIVREPDSLLVCEGCLDLIVYKKGLDAEVRRGQLLF